MPRLVVLRGPDLGLEIPLSTGLFTLGRERGNAIHINDDEISRKHLEIIVDSQNQCQIRDLKSANGTFVNSKRIDSQVLKPGDRIQIGQTVLEYPIDPKANAEGQATAKIRLVNDQTYPLNSSIIRSVSADLGSQILNKPGSGVFSSLQDRLANLRIIYEVTNAVSGILDQDKLLAKLLELTFEAVEADQGSILLIDPETKEVMPSATRSRHPEKNEPVIISRTIIDHVMTTNEGVLLSNASEDSRFNTGESVNRYHIEEVICVPMQGRHERVGLLFLLTSSGLQRTPHTTPRFREDQLLLAVAIAHQAAIAIEETRFHQAMLQSERLAAIGQTIAALSHHIKNIMQGIVFGSDMVRTGLDAEDYDLLRKGWRLVDKNQSKIHDLVLDMLSYSKDREPLLERTDLNHLVEDVLEVLTGRIQQQEVTLTKNLNRTLPRIQADPEGIHRSLLNLIGNAIDALTECDLPRELLVETRLDSTGHMIQVVIQDNGHGIPPEQVEAIFRPFVSSKGARGTGLGLPVSRKILREHGGDVRGESEAGKGSRFILSLPVNRVVPPESGGTQLFELPLSDPNNSI
jgi:signal transduction histidine kinase